MIFKTTERKEITIHLPEKFYRYVKSLRDEYNLTIFDRWQMAKILQALSDHLADWEGHGQREHPHKAEIELLLQQFNYLPHDKYHLIGVKEQ